MFITKTSLFSTNHNSIPEKSENSQSFQTSCQSFPLIFIKQWTFIKKVQVFTSSNNGMVSVTGLFKSDDIHFAKSSCNIFSIRFSISANWDPKCLKLKFHINIFVGIYISTTYVALISLLSDSIFSLFS